MKKLALTAAILLPLVSSVPSQAQDAASNARSDMFKALILNGAYARVCAVPLSKTRVAMLRYALQELGHVDSDLLEISVNTFKSLIEAKGGISAWCRDTTISFQQQEAAIVK